MLSYACAEGRFLRLFLITLSAPPSPPPSRLRLPDSFICYLINTLEPLASGEEVLRGVLLSALQINSAINFCVSGGIESL